MDFKNFDRRNYPTVPARAGYGEWASTYEEAVPIQLDIRVLESLKSFDWSIARECLDLGCGTGRTAEWLKTRGVATIDGIDLTPEMLERARAKELYRSLYSGVGRENRNSACSVRSHCHVPSRRAPFRPGALSIRKHIDWAVLHAKFVVVGMHPSLFMTGMPTHFKDFEGNPKAVETHIHLVSDHVRAALEAGWTLTEMYEGVIDEEWVRVKPKWAPLKNHPVNFGYVWHRNG